MTPKITYKREGPTPADIAKAMGERFAGALVSDLKATPAQYAGTGRDGGTPYDKTGTLIGGIHFKPASRTGQAVGLIGKIRAPMTRFANKFVQLGFVRRFTKLWTARGQGWSRKAGG